MIGNPELLVGESASIRELRRLIRAVAPARIAVLIEGDTGTGKELVAAMLHRESGRDGAFVAFNVCAVGETMFEDALFGHVKGAYTGALGESLGFLREANGGSAFFDEIGGLGAPMQAKLLRALESGVFRPIGASRDARSDFRTIAATNEHVDDLVAVGRLRSDLAHRLSGIVLSVPALAERVEDISMLAEHFARSVPVTPGARRLLEDRTWSGNVRELKQVIDAALVFSRTVLDADAISTALAHRSRRSRERVALAERSAPSSGFGESASDWLSVERQRVTRLLDVADWNAERVAADLGVHRSTLYRRLKRLGIVLPPAMCAAEFARARAAGV
ncbi:MAG: sigma 54-interacting transcriptional regulator [Gemmatimonadaceae bacterium]